MVDFVLRELPPPPARVLEVGCGQGDLAYALAASGHGVLAIDPEAPEGPLFRRATIEELDEPGPFDAVVASRSLHHVSDLAVVLDTIARLLRAGGVLLVDEFGWEHLNSRSADHVGIGVEEWREEHAGLHTARSMISELERRFRRRSLSWEPYLYRESREVLTEAEERRLIETGAIEAIGFRYVGVR